MSALPEDHKLQVELTVSADDAAQLRFALGLEPDADIGVFLQACTQTAAEMFLDEVVGRADYPTKSAARQIRLYKLATHAFDNTMPSPELVASLFHITTQSAGTLISSTAARFSRQLRTATDNAVRGILKGELRLRRRGDTREENIYYFRCADASVIQRLKATLASSAQPVHPLVRDADATNVFDIHASALEVILSRYDLTLQDLLPRETLVSIQKQKSTRGK